MAPEYVAIIVTISVLGGVIVIALIAVCIAKCAADRKLKREGGEAQPYGDTVALHNVNGQASFVRYPAPEPYTPAPYDSEDNPWRFSFANKPPVQEEYNAAIVDVPDRAILHDPPGPHMSRRPSKVQDLSRRSTYLQDPPRRPSYVRDHPRRSSQAQDLPRRSSQAHAMPRRSSNAPDIIRRPSINRSGQEPPSGHQNKLWYNYLKEDPNYYTKEVLERNKKRSRAWPAEEGKRSPSPPPRYEVSQQQHRHQPAPRSNWM